jgi:ribonuclease P protein component
VRVGFTVSKKVGNAVERNRVRRRLREVVRHAGSTGVRPGFDYVLIGRRRALDLPFDRLIEDFGRALERVHRAHAGDSGAGSQAGGNPNTAPLRGTR